jgi:uncharacterized repeat protein (TIGR01451 family)
MTKLKKTFHSWTAAVLFVLVAGGVAAFAQRHFAIIGAAPRPDVKVLLSASLEKDGKQAQLDKSQMVHPGDIISWTIDSKNEGNAPAQQYKAVAQIPKAMTFVAGSATSDGSATVVYSIDEGKTFQAQPIIEEKQDDGTVKQVPAPVSLYTNLRYEWSDPLAASGTLAASYKVRVK